MSFEVLSLAEQAITPRALFDRHRCRSTDDCLKISSVFVCKRNAVAL